MIKLGMVMCRAWRLNIDKRKVVAAKLALPSAEDRTKGEYDLRERPRGAGLPNLRR